MPLIQWIMQNLSQEPVTSPACLHIHYGENVTIDIVAQLNADIDVTFELETSIGIVTRKVCNDMANNIGDDMRVEGTWTASDGSPIDPTTVSLLVEDPAGAVTTYTYPIDIIRTGVGQFYTLVPLTQPGPWRGRYISTGAGKAAEPFAFFVDPDEF